MNYQEFKKYILENKNIKKSIKKEFENLFETVKGPKNENKYIEYKKNIYNQLINKIKQYDSKLLTEILNLLEIDEGMFFNYVYRNIKKFHYSDIDINNNGVFSFDNNEESTNDIKKEIKKENANIRDFEELSNGINKIKNGTIELFLRLDEKNTIKAEIKESSGEILWLQINDKKTTNVTKELIYRIKERMKE